MTYPSSERDEFMPEPLVDLRSDTVTKPSEAMRKAMHDAEVGDDVYREDPTVNRLQDRAAEIFEREAGLFVVSGTMGNQTAIKVLTRHGQEVICEDRCHIYNFEMGMIAAFSGVVPRTDSRRRRHPELGPDRSARSQPE
jgi:threonine aldolase